MFAIHGLGPIPAPLAGPHILLVRPGFAHHLVQRTCFKLLPAHALNILSPGSRIHHHLPAMSVKIALLVARTAEFVRPVIDPCVVEHQHARPDVIMEMMHVHEREERRRERHSRRRTRRPANVIRTLSPRHPRGRPVNAWDPDPPVIRIIEPRTIMITSPSPRLIRLPIPTRIRPDPLSVFVRPPIRPDPRRMPAPAIIGHVHPTSVGREGLIKIGRRIDLYAGGDLHLPQATEVTAGEGGD